MGGAGGDQINLFLLLGGFTPHDKRRRLSFSTSACVVLMCRVRFEYISDSRALRYYSESALQLNAHRKTYEKYN